jgi:hypothetical protein
MIGQRMTQKLMNTLGSLRFPPWGVLGPVQLGVGLLPFGLVGKVEI